MIYKRIFLFCVVFVFMQVGFHSGQRYHAQLEYLLVGPLFRRTPSPGNADSSLSFFPTLF